MSSHKMCVMQNQEPIRDHYALDRRPQSFGRDSIITKGTHLSTGLAQAIKSSKKRLQNLEQLKLEVSIMKMMDHPNIVKLVETFEDQRSIHLVMEMCSGGQLFDRILSSDGGKFMERTAA